MPDSGNYVKAPVYSSAVGISADGRVLIYCFSALCLYSRASLKRMLFK
jgi:hypothetical protein